MLLLTSFFASFLAARESNFSSCFLKPWALPGSKLCVCSHVSGTHHACFLWARHSWEPVSSLSTRFLSYFRSLLKVSGANLHWAIVYQPFSFFYTLASSSYFLAWHKHPLRPRSTAWARNPQEISKLINKGWLLLQWLYFLVYTTHHGVKGGKNKKWSQSHGQKLRYKVPQFWCGVNERVVIFFTYGFWNSKMEKMLK